MILVPMLFFAILTGYLCWKHGLLDISVYMGALHLLSSVFAIILVTSGLLGEGGVLFRNDNVELNLVPTLLYCCMIGLSVLPFSLVYVGDIKRITCRRPLLLDIFSCILIAVSFLNLYLVAESTLDILSGDLGDVRRMHYLGVESPAAEKAQTLNFMVKNFYMFNVSTILAIPIFFYNVCFRNKAWWFNGLLVFSSLSCPLVSIQTADRAEMVFYGLMLVYCLIFFRPFMTKKIKRGLLLLGIPIVAGAVTYLVAVSMSRFDGQGKASSTDRTLQYAGQGYLNFCYYYEYGNFDHVATERVFPFYTYARTRKQATGEFHLKRQRHQPFYVGVFTSFAGDIMQDTSPVGMVCWVLCYFLLVTMLVRRAHREEFDVSEVLALYALAIIPVFGFFFYRFYLFSSTLMMSVVAALYALSRCKIYLK